ncbi:protein of unknown function [Paraburkholderia kururiensis]
MSSTRIRSRARPTWPTPFKRVFRRIEHGGPSRKKVPAVRNSWFTPAFALSYSFAHEPHPVRTPTSPRSAPIVGAWLRHGLARYTLHHAQAVRIMKATDLRGFLFFPLPFSTF